MRAGTLRRPPEIRDERSTTSQTHEERSLRRLSSTPASERVGPSGRPPRTSLDTAMMIVRRPREIDLASSRRSGREMREADGRALANTRWPRARSKQAVQNTAGLKAAAGRVGVVEEAAAPRGPVEIAAQLGGAAAKIAARRRQRTRRVCESSQKSWRHRAAAHWQSNKRGA